MKKNILFTMLFLFVIASYTSAQWTGGGEEQRVTKEKPKTFEDKNFLRFGMAIPSGNFGETSGEDAGAAKTGFILQYGGIRYFDWDINTNQFAFGFNFPLSFSLNNWENNTTFPSGTISDINYRPYIFVGFGLGPLISYSPSNDLIIDAFYNIKPTISGAMGLKGETPSGEVDYYSNAAFALNNNYGMNLRYGNFMLGIDFMPSEFSYEMITEVDGYEIENSPQEIDISTSTTNLTIGILF